MEEVLKPAFMAVAIIGFIVSAIWTVSGQLTSWFDPWGGENLGLSLGFSFCLIFVIMFIATMVTMRPK
jgi:formate/nitrite transporter FocA (FNT family)